MHVLEMLSSRYPQLLLPIESGISKTETYKNAVLRGIKVDTELAFSLSAQDALSLYQTPFGDVDVLFLANRNDFEHAYMALAYRCEPTAILPSVGAGIISGLINWKKIHEHQSFWQESGHTDWPTEFRRFTSEKQNYCDTLILLSSGPYSAIPAEWVYMAADEWARISVQIRMYHELTHFICRKAEPKKKDKLRDEIYADCIGLLSAFGKYDTKMAKLFLGIENDSYRYGGRLEHYSGDQLEEAICQARYWITEAETRVASTWKATKTDNWNMIPESEKSRKIFDLLLKIY